MRQTGDSTVSGAAARARQTSSVLQGENVQVEVAPSSVAVVQMN